MGIYRPSRRCRVVDPEKKTERYANASEDTMYPVLFIVWLCDIVLLELLASVALEDKTIGVL